jgi:hypothetical protein
VGLQVRKHEDQILHLQTASKQHHMRRVADHPLLCLWIFELPDMTISNQQQFFEIDTTSNLDFEITC